jgi:hypothetical protein
VGAPNPVVREITFVANQDLRASPRSFLHARCVPISNGWEQRQYSNRKTNMFKKQQKQQQQQQKQAKNLLAPMV